MLDKPKISALVINLSSATERWNFQQKQLDKLGLPYQRWEATAVSCLTNDEYEKWANDWQRKLRRTEVACFLSHYQIWQHIAKGEKPLFTARMKGYTAVLVILTGLLIGMLFLRNDVEATILRLPGQLYETKENNVISNVFTYKLINFCFC